MVAAPTDTYCKMTLRSTSLCEVLNRGVIERPAGRLTGMRKRVLKLTDRLCRPSIVFIVDPECGSEPVAHGTLARARPGASAASHASEIGGKDGCGKRRCRDLPSNLVAGCRFISTTTLTC
jgi:hypothetical protein